MAKIGRRHKAGTGRMMHKAHAVVAKQPSKSARAERVSSTLGTPAASFARDSASQTHPPSFGSNAHVDFDGIEAMDIDEDAFAVTKGNKPRGPASARKAKSRAVNKIAAAIKSSGNKCQQVLALRDTLAHPTIIKIAKSAGFESELQRVAMFNMSQQSRFLATAMETDKSKARATDDKRFLPNLCWLLLPHHQNQERFQVCSPMLQHWAFPRHLDGIF